MKTAYTGWMWVREHEGNREKFREQFEQSVLELKYLGYDVLENWTFLRQYFTAEEIREICARHNIQIACLYANLDEGMVSLKESIEFCAAIGAGWMICASPNWLAGVEHDAPMDMDEIKREAVLLNELGAYARERGVTLLHNPHSYTPVCRRPDIDALMSLTDPELVKLCVDAGHSVVAGVDAIALVRDYADRVDYIHIKDLDPALAYRGRGQSWVPLGMGTVHLSAFMNTLKEVGFDGVVCAGLPTGCERINRFESARISRQYLRQIADL